MMASELPIDRIICGDNVEVMSTFPDACIDLVVTSPPYDNLRKYGGHTWDFEGVAQQLWRIIKPGGVVVWVVADATINGSETGTSFRQALRFMEIGFRLHDTMIWERCGAFPESNRYHPDFEYMFILSNGKPTTANIIKDRKTSNAGVVCRSRMERQPDGVNRRPNRVFVNAEYAARYNIWQIPSSAQEAGADTIIHGHPATFSQSLARDHILSWSNDGDIVLDPFSGSGTTAKMARECGRRYIGIEIHEEYCEIAHKRLAQGLLFQGASC